MILYTHDLVHTQLCTHRMDTADNTQINATREQYLYSHHTTSSTYTTMSNTTVPILFSSQADLV